MTTGPQSLHQLLKKVNKKKKPNMGYGRISFPSVSLLRSKVIRDPVDEGN